MIPVWTGHLGTMQTLQLMRKIVFNSITSKKLCAIARTLWLNAKLTNKDALTVADEFLRSRFEYLDESIETIQAPEYMISGLEVTGKLRGDCDDITTLHAALLTCMDIPVRFVVIRSKFEDPNFDHVYLEAQQSNGDWVSYDITLPLGTEIHYFGRATMQV